MADGRGRGSISGADRVPLPFGLLSVVPMRGDSESARISMGVQWEQLTCAPATGQNYDCENVSEKGFVSGGGVAEAEPFTVIGSYLCGPIGHNRGYGQSQALQHLLTREEAVVERTFWTGELGNSPFLADGAETLGSGAVDAEVGVALLEKWLADNYGSLGIIHMDRAAATIAITSKAVEVKGGKLQTKLGTPVVAGGGYPGTSPDGDDPSAGTSWIYASPAVFGYRSEVVPNSELDREVNLEYALAERLYLLGYDDCGTAAVSITLDADA